MEHHDSTESPAVDGGKFRFCMLLAVRLPIGIQFALCFSIQEPERPMEPPTTWTYWVVPGRFLAGCFPGERDTEKQGLKLEQLLEAGVRTFVDLMEPHEVNHWDEPIRPYADHLTGLAAKQSLGVSYRRFPIRDLGLPTHAQMEEVLCHLDQSLYAGSVVYIHCWGGVGRTGTVVGCWLLRRGLATPETVLEHLAELRKADRERGHRPSPETGQQRRFVQEWSSPASSGDG